MTERRQTWRSALVHDPAAREREREFRAAHFAQAGPREPDGMTERVEVLTPTWHIALFLLGLVVIPLALIVLGPGVAPVP